MSEKIKENSEREQNIFLSHNNPCFWCNIAITNFFISHTYEIGFHNVVNRTVHMFTSWHHLMQKPQNKANLHGKMSMFWTLIF